MPIEVTMPKLSDTMEEGKILRWLKHTGDAVAIGDIIAEVETDKANMELEAYDEGTLAEVRVDEGESAPVGAVIALLAAPGEKTGGEKAVGAAPKHDTPSTPQARDGEQPAETSSARQGAKAGTGSAERPPDDGEDAVEAPRPAEREGFRPRVVRRPEPSEPEGEKVKASPLARKIAREQGVDLHAVRGSGPGGRIVEKDVEAAAAQSRGETAATPPAAEGRRETTEAPRAPAPAARPQAGSGERRPAAPPTRRLDLSRLRRTTAKRMAEAKREIPHFYASAEIGMDEAVRLKNGLAALGGDYEGITFTHLVLKATGLALVRVPEVNASYDGDALVLHDEVNVGMATAVDEGLIVPVVHHCDREPLAAIVRQARGVVERARAGRFAGDDLSGGTFTVSNLGMFPVSDFAAVINPPQAAILAIGTIREVAVVKGAQLVPGRVMTVTLSCDHRVIDGVLAGRFLRELKGLLEQPLALLA